jgi:hypothetical protein
MGKPERKSSLGKPKHRWGNNIKIDLKETGWQHRNSVHQAQDKDIWGPPVNMAMNLKVPLNAGNLVTSLEMSSFSRRTLLHGVTYQVITLKTRD